MSVSIEGLDAIIDKLDDITDQDKLYRALGKACALVERSAKQKAPKGTGELRNSITSKVENLGGEMVGVVFTPLEYAPYVEFGTGIFAEEGGRTDVPWAYQDDEGNWHSTEGQSPQPFMRPALYENVKKINEIVGKELTDA
jgi:HK97 gp10 family phage protein